MPDSVSSIYRSLTFQGSRLCATNCASVEFTDLLLAISPPDFMCGLLIVYYISNLTVERN
jgi:hypothetical protein